MMKTHIVLHHSLTSDSGTLSWDNIRDYHIQHNRWDDIGYHFGIERIENSHQVLVGRGLMQDGAHCPQQRMNQLGVGICFVGNFDEREPDTGLLDVGHKLCVNLCMVLGIPIKNIYGHRDFNSSKSCPGNLFDVEAFRHGVSQMITGKKYAYLRGE